MLGPLQVWRDGTPLPVPGGRRRSVLAALLVNAGRPVTADALVEAAWGDQPPANPRAALHTVLSRLRTLLGEDAIGAHPAGYLLGIPGSGVDSQEFEALHARAG